MSAPPAPPGVRALRLLDGAARTLRSAATAVVAGLEAFALPQRCPGCGAEARPERLLCDGCLALAQPLAVPLCARCLARGAEPVGCIVHPGHAVWAGWVYDERVALLVHALKYGDRPGLARELSAGLARALPGRPASFVLYFVIGKDELTDESSAELQRVLAELKSRPIPDVAVIGHTDSVGGTEANDALSLQRAERVKGFLAGIGIDPARIQVSGRGERELLVPTGDNVAEPRNRRVEINVR